jgi:hypothetical protein
MTLQEVERWLGPWLNYDPAKAIATGSPVACGCGQTH